MRRLPVPNMPGSSKESPICVDDDFAVHADPAPPAPMVAVDAPQVPRAQSAPPGEALVPRRSVRNAPPRPMGPVTAVVDQCKFYGYGRGARVVSGHYYEVERGEGNRDLDWQSAQEVDMQLAISFLIAHNYMPCKTCCSKIWDLKEH